MTSETEKTKDSQHARYIEKARELGCDEDDNRFNATLKKIAKSESWKKNVSRQSAKKSNDGFTRHLFGGLFCGQPFTAAKIQIRRDCSAQGSWLYFIAQLSGLVGASSFPSRMGV